MFSSFSQRSSMNASGSPNAFGLCDFENWKRKVDFPRLTNEPIMEMFLYKEMDDVY